MGKTTKAKATSLIGFTYGGFFKHGYVRVFKHSGSFEEVYEQLKFTLGDSIVGRYALTSDVDTHFDAVCKQCDEYKSGENVFKINVTPLANIIKEVTGAKKLSHFGPDKEEDVEDTKKIAPKKTKKDDTDVSESEDGSSASDEEVEDKKPVKKVLVKKMPEKKVPEKKAPEKKAPEKKTPVKKETPKKETPKKSAKSEDDDTEDDSD
jgi:hypothetical protein